MRGFFPQPRPSSTTLVSPLYLPINKLSTQLATTRSLAPVLPFSLKHNVLSQKNPRTARPPNNNSIPPKTLLSSFVLPPLDRLPDSYTANPLPAPPTAPPNLHMAHMYPTRADPAPHNRPPKPASLARDGNSIKLQISLP